MYCKSIWRLQLLVFALACIGTTAVAKTPTVDCNRFDFVVLGDEHGGKPGEYEAVWHDLDLLAPDFVINAGDAIQGYCDIPEARRQWDAVLSVSRKRHVPYYLVPGNHDIWDDPSEKLYVEMTRFKPYYSFDWHNAHFVVLDSSRIPDTGPFPKEQIDWLTKDLEAHKGRAPTFVFFHRPYWAVPLTKGQPPSLHDVFKKYGVTAVFSAHAHQYAYARYDGIDYVMVGVAGGYLPPDATKAEGQFSQFMWVAVRGRSARITLFEQGHVYPTSFRELR